MVESLGKKLLIMKVLDFLFIIFYAPFVSMDGGRQAAIICLAPTLTFYLTAFLIRLIHFLFDVRIFSYVSALIASVLSLLIFIVVCILLYRVYVKEERYVGEIGLRWLRGMMIPVVFIGSIIFFIYTVKHFG